MYWVYIVASASGTLYIGVTSDIERRIAQHKSRSIPGFASKYRCMRLVFAEMFADVRDAIAAEKRLKGWRRAKKVALVERHNPAWADLAAIDVTDPERNEGTSTARATLFDTCTATETQVERTARSPPPVE